MLGAAGSAARHVLKPAWMAAAAPLGAPTGFRCAVVGPLTLVPVRLKALVPAPGVLHWAKLPVRLAAPVSGRTAAPVRIRSRVAAAGWAGASLIENTLTRTKVA